MHTKPMWLVGGHIKKRPPISVDQLNGTGHFTAVDGRSAAGYCAFISTDGEIAADDDQFLAKQPVSASFGSPNDAGLRRFYKPFSANLRVTKGFSFVQDGQAGPSFAHLAAFGLKVQVL